MLSSRTLRVEPRGKGRTRHARRTHKARSACGTHCRCRALSSARQGPNYCLAKRIQHWRAIVARDEGHIVASNVAPSTATLSVVSNASFAVAYAGMHNFKPFEVMYAKSCGFCAAMLSRCGPSAAGSCVCRRVAVHIGRTCAMRCLGTKTRRPP